MTETPADVSTDEKRYSSSSEKSNTSFVCDNDSDFNDAESFDKEF